MVVGHGDKMPAMFAKPSIATLFNNKAISGDELINTDTGSNIQSTIQVIDAIFHLHLVNQRDLKIETTFVLLTGSRFREN